MPDPTTAPTLAGNAGRRPAQPSYAQFLLADYQQVAKAYFNTTALISSFFRHYLLIVSLPAPLIALAAKWSPDGRAGPLAGGLAPYMPTVALGIAFTGLFVMGYLVTLRCEGRLYVRHVNGIRKYFTKTARLAREELDCIVLPTDPSLPPYYDPHHFLCVVAALSLINALYFGGGIALLLSAIRVQEPWWGALAFALSFLFFFLFSWMVYWLLARKCESLWGAPHTPSAASPGKGECTPSQSPER